ncbi:unnamed protein product [Rhizophagus irregularis]|uniref:Uncharacterized protein n=1 Tax=Rhizophagus irregularis TaxID=588596 RepID=A0A915ZIR4_9GLOM|nr:hypothetical protein GLOIN_2v1482112 [Rhizophagus irregularis DAOM 181602=DAOM 197198]CAB4486512.1 unnamed protein product [Rhizophagus irregularis]CAB5378196.1 unnamed protein product [Rhizophagus irregularis]
MWACLNKTCPCLPIRGDSKPPFSHYSYDDDDNFEFESLLAGQDSESIGAFLTRAPFANSQGYRRVTNMVTPNEEASASTGRVSNLLDDEDNLQTQDAQFLPDEQISKFTELISGQVKDDQGIDEQLIAEEEEARRLEEEDIIRKRQAATEAALAKGLITPDQAAANNKDAFFTIDDDDDGDDGQITDSSRTIYSMNESIDEEQNISLNKPRNPHERFIASEIHEEDYDEVTDFEEDLPPTTSKDQTTAEDLLMEDYSPFSVSILRSDDYETSHEDYSPTVGDEEIDHPFANILPDFSEKLGSLFNGLTNSMIKGKNKLINNEGNREINNNNNNQEINNLNDLDTNNGKNNRKKMVTFTVEPESSIEPSSPISYSFAFGGGNSISGRRGLRKLVSGLSNSSRSSLIEVNE